MTQILEEIVDRRSIRAYQDRDVSDDQIMALLEAARLAPSGSNTQPWRFIIVRSEEQKQAIMTAPRAQTWMLTAPVFIVCLADMKCREKENPSPADDTSPSPNLKKIIRDSAICIEHILLQAQHMGLGACWAGWFDQEPIKAVFDIPAEYYVTGIVTVGYAAQDPQPKPRIPLEDLIWYERFGQKAGQ